MSNLNSRRKFLVGTSLLGTGLLVGNKFVGTVFAAEKGDIKKKAVEDAAKKKGDDLIDEKSSLASTLKYHHDASKVPAALLVAKAGVEGSKQRCTNCMFYTKEKGEGASEVGKCQLFPQGKVKGIGWCNSWTKKA